MSKWELSGKCVWVAGHRGMAGAAIVRRLARVLGVRPQELMAPEEDEEKEQAVA